MKKILDTLELRFTDEEIAEQIWFDNYDTVFRIIPIPCDIVDDIRKRMDANNITIDNLCENINANADLSPEINKNNKYPFNEWQARVVDHKIKSCFIKMKVDADKIQKILIGEKTSTNYVTMLAVIYHIIRFEKPIEKSEDKDEYSYKLMEEAKLYLNQHKFFSLVEKKKLAQQVHTKQEYEAISTTFDKKNVELVNKILQILRVLSDMNIEKTNEYLSSFMSNLKWDSGFMMRLISLPFSEIEDVSFTIKKELMKKIEDDIEQTKQVPDEQKKVENYE